MEVEEQKSKKEIKPIDKTLKFLVVSFLIITYLFIFLKITVF